MPERICSKCGLSKPETEEFFRRRGTKDRGGLRPDCRVCTAARDKAYYATHREAVLAAQKADPRRLARQPAYKRAYYATEQGREVINRANRRWAHTPEGREALARAQQRRRARRAGAPADFNAADWVACLEWFEHRCGYCGAAVENLTQDHVVPVESGGGYVPANIVPACLSCNSRKFTRALEDWFPAQPFYSEERMAMIATYIELVT